MIGRTNVGGGAGLNFKVVGNPQPSNPIENAIWIDTDTPITSYIFSAAQPTGEEGMVWIATGTTSTVEFNALKKNGITVYPMSAKQYVSGAWVDKTAKSYQNGEWVDWWNGANLYTPGNEYTDFTGGWVLTEKKGNSYTNIGTLTKDSDGLRINNNGSSAVEKGSFLRCANKIDLTPVSKIKATIVMVSGSVGGGNLLVTTDLTLSDWGPASVVAQSEDIVGDLTPEVDVSALRGEYYVGITSDASMPNRQAVLKVTEVVMT